MKSKENKFKIKWFVIGLLLGLFIGVIGVVVVLLHNYSVSVDKQLESEKIGAFCFEQVVKLNYSNPEKLKLFNFCLRYGI